MGFIENDKDRYYHKEYNISFECQYKKYIIIVRIGYLNEISETYLDMRSPSHLYNKSLDEITNNINRYLRKGKIGSLNE